MLPGLGGCIAGASASGNSSSTTGGLAASISRTSISKTSTTALSTGTQTVTSGTVTVTVASSTGATTFSWARISGDSRISATAPSASATTFSASLSRPEDYATATFECTVTDASGATVKLRCDVTLQLLFIG